MPNRDRPRAVPAGFFHVRFEGGPVTFLSLLSVPPALVPCAHARTRTRGPGRAVLAAAMLASVLAGGLSAPPAQAQAPAAAAAPAGPTLRAEFAAPLTAAQALLREGQFREALAKIAEAEALPAPTEHERFIIRRFKAPALLGAGDTAAALPLLEALLADPQLPAADRPAFSETVVRGALQLKDYARALRWMKPYLDAGGTDPEIRRLYPHVQLQQGDAAGAAAGFAAQMAAEEAAGRAPTEAQLRLLASAQAQAKDDAGYLGSLERLAASTGKPEYWDELIARTARRDGFAGERLRLDLYRLRRAAGLKLSAGELGDMAERAYQAGLPAEAQALLDEGFNAGLLGKDGNAAADRKLREQATKAANQDRVGLADSEAGLRNAKDGNAAYGLGLALSGAGLHDKAVALMGQGLAKGGLRRPQDAQLHLGLVQWRAGKAEEARKTWAGVTGADGPAALARLWTLLSQRPTAVAAKG